MKRRRFVALLGTLPLLGSLRPMAALATPLAPAERFVISRAWTYPSTGGAMGYAATLLDRLTGRTMTQAVRLRSVIGGEEQADIADTILRTWAEQEALMLAHGIEYDAQGKVDLDELLWIAHGRPAADAPPKAWRCDRCRGIVFDLGLLFEVETR